MSSPREQKRLVAITLAFLAAAALVVACAGQKWLVSPRGDDSSIGLVRVQVCEDGQCEAMSNFRMIDELRKIIESVKKMNKDRPPREQIAVPRAPWGGFPIVGIITAIASIFAAGGLVHAAILAIRRRRPELTIMPTTIAVLGLGLAIINGCLVVATKPEMVEDMAVGWSFWTFGAGAVLGLAAVFPLNRQIRPIDEELGAASATMSWGGSRDDQ
jgi:hypothetical protein